MKTSRTPQNLPDLDLEQQKQSIAYQLWEEEGRPEGKAEEHWAQACLVVMSLSEGEALPSPVWLKRQDGPMAVETATQQSDSLDNISKRTAARRAA